MYVEMKNIYKKYGDFLASDNVSFGVEKGKLVALLGPSGSGKTTLLRMIAGLETPNSGDIYIDGKRVNDIPASKRGIGFVFQNYALFRYMTIYDNVAFGLELQKMPKKLIKERVTKLLEMTGLSGLEKRYPNQLSGGQRQRVAFARALAPNPQVLLLDEPFAAIDAKVRGELRTWLKELVEKLGITSIFVTHDQDEAVEVADEIIITNHGTIEQMGTPLEIYKSPDTPFVAQFIGHTTVVENYDRLKGFDRIENADKAVIRPEFIKISKSGNLDRYQSAAEQLTSQMAESFEKAINPTFQKMTESLEILTESVTKCQEDVVQDILRTFLREMNGSFKMQFTDFNEALVQLKEAQKENIDYTTRLYQTMSNQLNTSYAKQSEAMKDLVNELGQVQGRYMSTATRITQDNQEIQKLQQQDYQRIADYLHESEKSSAKFWVACNQTMQKYVEAAAQGMEKVSAANQAGKDVLEANRKLVEQLDVKMKDFVSYQKMTYETMEEVRRLFADISVQKEDNNIYLSGGKSAQSAAQKESVEEVRKLLEEQSERQEALLEEMNKNMKNISKNQKGKFSLFK